MDSSPLLVRWILQKMKILQWIQGLGLSINHAYLKMWKYRIARTDQVTAKETVTRSQTSRAELLSAPIQADLKIKNMNTNKYEYPGNSMILYSLHGQCFQNQIGTMWLDPTCTQIKTLPAWAPEPLTDVRCATLCQHGGRWSRRKISGRGPPAQGNTGNQVHLR